MKALILLALLGGCAGGYSYSYQAGYQYGSPQQGVAYYNQPYGQQGCNAPVCYPIPYQSAPAGYRAAPMAFDSMGNYDAQGTAAIRPHVIVVR